jgi:toxin ParE1/3/4
MTVVRKLPQAREDLLDIWLHIGRDSPSRADRYLDLLESKLHLLSGSPHMGRLHTYLAQGLRGLPVDDYIILYREADDGIEVVRVLHGARDIESLFRDS